MLDVNVFCLAWNCELLSSIIDNSEPGIRLGKEHSRGNENRKSREKFFPQKNKLTSVLFF